MQPKDIAASRLGVWHGERKGTNDAQGNRLDARIQQPHIEFHSH